MDAQTIQEMILLGLPEAQVEVVGADGAHFEALIVSKDFDGKTLIQRHRMVYETLGNAMHADIHALSMKTLTADEHGAE